MKDRIQQILIEKKLTAARFAEIMDVQPSSISHLLSGRNNPNSEFIIKLLHRFPDINPDWFLLGTGSMMRNVPVREISQEKELPLPGKPSTLVPESEKNNHLAIKKHIEKVIVFYSDKSFAVYTQEE